MIKLSSIALTLALALSTASAYGQLGIYGTFGGTRLTNSDSNTSSWFYGPGLGVYYDFLHFGPIGAGLDLRGTQLFQSGGARYRSELLGVRVAVKPPLLPIRPYVQGSIGVGGAKPFQPNGGFARTYSRKLQYHVFAGLDFTVFPRLDWRVVEVGYGRMSGVGSGAVAPADKLVTVTSGIVFRLPI